MILNYNEVCAHDYAERVRAIISNEKKYYYVYTFGCQQNEADSEKIRALAEDMGYIASSDPMKCDLVIVNTCAIRAHAEMKALSLLGSFRAVKKKNPDFILGVVGCMPAQSNVAKSLKEKFHYVSFTAEPNMLYRIPELVYNYMSEHRRTFVFGEDEGNIVEGISAVRQSGHKAWVSIMYGCNNFCTYCIVPYVRGRERSRNSADVISECRELVKKGIREITLLGQNVNSYRSDMNFPELISAIAEIEGDFLIRFMTSHPKDTSDELITAMAKYKDKIAPYFHLPLQSGSDAVLKKMNRTYTRERFVSIVEKLRKNIPNICLSTDIIVGFPGESDEDFEDTLDILRRAEIDSVYAFLYSPREGTPAAKMQDQIPDDIKSERIKRLFALQDGISYDKNLPYLNNEYRVLVDSFEERDGDIVYTGRTATNKLVHFTSDGVGIGEFTKVKITKTGGFDLIGVETK